MFNLFKKSLPTIDSKDSKDSKDLFVPEWVEILCSNDLNSLDKNGSAVQEKTDLIVHPMNDPKIVELNYHILSAIYQTNPTSITICVMFAAIFCLKAFAKEERMLTSLKTEERSDDCSFKM